jgi:S-disulfanyl-L-cysteine oxidoreductase SoxD
MQHPVFCFSMSVESRMRVYVRFSAAILVLAIVVSASLGGEPINGQASGRTVWDGVFTTAQAERGRDLYLDHCADCHGPALEGGEEKALKGERFWTDWQETTVDYLLGRISKNMPYSEDGLLAGSLGMPAYVDVVAHLLRTNDFPAGPDELTAASSVGVQVIKKTGPSELPAHAFAHVVGCLARGPGADWTLTQGSRPVRILDGRPPDEKTPLGDRGYTLKFVTTALDSFIGHRMSVSAALMGEGGREGLNVRRITSIGARCQ